MKPYFFILILLLGHSSLNVAAQLIKVFPPAIDKVTLNTKLVLNQDDPTPVSAAISEALLPYFGDVSLSGIGAAKLRNYFRQSSQRLISMPFTKSVAFIFDGNYFQYYTGVSNYCTFISLLHSFNHAQRFGYWFDVEKSVAIALKVTDNTSMAPIFNYYI